VFFEAVFQPLKKKAYSAEMRRFVGKKIPIQGGWISKEGDHKGQQCFYLTALDVNVIPASDLKNITNISFVRWKEFHSAIVKKDE